MEYQKFEVGDLIEVFEPRLSQFPMTGKILELDTHPFEYGSARVEIDSPALPTPVEWVSLRNARKI